MPSVGPVGPSGVPQNYPEDDMSVNQKMRADIDGWMGTVYGLMSVLNSKPEMNLKGVLSDLKAVTAEVQEMSSDPSVPQNVREQVHSAYVSLNTMEEQVNGWVQEGKTPTAQEIDGFTQSGEVALNSFQNAENLIH